MKTFPLKSLSIKQAKELQFKLIEEITKEFKGGEFLNLGDLGVVQPNNQPTTTLKTEKVIANFFDSEACKLIRGSGTAAIRFAFQSCLNTGDKILVHNAPIYPTTLSTIEMMGLKYTVADYNDYYDLIKVIDANPDIKAVLIQYTRQTISDKYDIAELIKVIKKHTKAKIITDDNYAALKVEYIGSQLSADLSCFSCFKLLGPEGVGCVVGKAELIEKINKLNYSGGSQVQGFEAQEVLRGFTYAPVALALQAEVIEEVVQYFQDKKNPIIKDVTIANAQSKVLLIEFSENIAAEVLKQAELLGAAPHPVGAESKYELIPMFYRVSGTFAEADSSLRQRMIRINPMRSGSNTIIRILLESIERAKNVSK
ncbi:MAG: aminotransferase class V-fold PLP-dependent enzyme [Erysipelotrichaceae bacterium]